MSIFVPWILAQGHIVNTASSAALALSSGLEIYKVSKHGVVTLSETVALELAARRAKIKSKLRGGNAMQSCDGA